MSILKGVGGGSLWPLGVIGSITHFQDYCGATVHRRGSVVSTGIDAELNRPLPTELVDSVALPDELGWLHKARATPMPIDWDTFLFCIKEYVYKAWYPVAHS